MFIHRRYSASVGTLPLVDTQDPWYNPLILVFDACNFAFHPAFVHLTFLK